MPRPGWSRTRRCAVFLAIVGVTAVIAGCAGQPPPDTSGAPGFFYGLLHGFLILIDFVVGRFSDVRIYAYPNSGGWYDFGFLLGASMFLGGGGGAGARRG